MQLQKKPAPVMPAEKRHVRAVAAKTLKSLSTQIQTQKIQVKGPQTNAELHF